MAATAYRTPDADRPRLLRTAGTLLKVCIAAVSTPLLFSCTAMPGTAPQAAANLTPTQSNKVSGLVTFAEREGVVFVEASLTGLTPGRHGIHIHEKGDCTAPDASGAGGHFNPQEERHGGFRGTRRHLGDLGNITADASGNARMRVQADGVTLRSGPNSVVGRALVVHADPDDYRTQPDGGSGARVACGVIGLGELSPM